MHYRPSAAVHGSALISPRMEFKAYPRWLHGSRCSKMGATLLMAALACIVLLLVLAYHAKSSNHLHTATADRCPVAAVDWSLFTDPGSTTGGQAAIFTTRFNSLSLLWVIHGLQSLGYSVMLYALPHDMPAAQHFLKKQQDNLVADVQHVTISPVNIVGVMLSAPPVKLFVHVTTDGQPHVFGRGTANIFLVDSAQPTAANSVAASHHDADILATYDYVLYTTTWAYLQHIPSIMPVLEKIQLQSRMFPLVDIISLPAPPRMPASSHHEQQDLLGVTFSVSSYKAEQRPLLLDALKAYSTLRDKAPVPPRLVICSWLMPGIDEDRAFLEEQVKSFALYSWFEFRSDSTDDEPYANIDVQWHLYNQDAKPHYSATASMPAGVWVIDYTGSLHTLPDVAYGTATSMTELAENTVVYLQQPQSILLEKKNHIKGQSIKAVSALMDSKWFQIVHRAFRCKAIRFFMQQTQPVYQARLTPSIQSARALHGAHEATFQHGDYAAVIVEARPHYAFSYVVMNAAWYLPGWTLHVVHSRVNAQFVRNTLPRHLDVTYHQLEADNVDIDDYNNLMKSADFWQLFNAKYVLLFQTDSLILKPGLDWFAKYDYIGAPWHLENERWSQPALKAALPAGVGNGGFSLRSVNAMVRVCEQFTASSPLKEQEDVFFAVHIQQDPALRLADRRSAYDFCLEVPCRDMPAPQPFAVHAAWYYNDLTTMQILLDGSLYDLAKAC